MKIRDVPQTGSVGETVTYQSRFGIIRRRKVIPRDPRTGPQIDRRTAFQRARHSWGPFTAKQFLAWNTLATTRQTPPPPAALLGHLHRRAVPRLEYPGQHPPDPPGPRRVQ